MRIETGLYALPVLCEMRSTGVGQEIMKVGVLAPSQARKLVMVSHLLCGYRGALTTPLFLSGTYIQSAK